MQCKQEFRDFFLLKVSGLDTALYLRCTVNPGLLLEGEHLIFHFRVKELGLCLSLMGAFSFAGTIYHIKKDALFYVTPSVIHTGMTTTAAVYSERINCRTVSEISSLHLYAMIKALPLDQPVSTD